MASILVIGAAGKVGRCVAHRLTQEHGPPRLLLHQDSDHGVGARLERIFGDFNDVDLIRRACAGIEVVFTYVPRIDASASVFRAMREVGVRRVVVLSSASVIKAPPGVNPIAERHRAAEAAVQASAMQWTFIRPDTMASNCLQWARDIQQDGRVYAAYPESMRNPVHEDDLARLAVQALVSDTLLGRALYVTGPEVLSIRQQVKAIADALGRPLECVPITPQEAMDRMLAMDDRMSPIAAQRLLDYLAKTQATRPQISGDYQAVTGITPKAFAQWVTDNLESFNHATVQINGRHNHTPTAKGSPMSP